MAVEPPRIRVWLSRVHQPPTDRSPFDQGSVHPGRARRACDRPRGGLAGGRASRSRRRRRRRALRPARHRRGRRPDIGRRRLAPDDQENSPEDSNPFGLAILSGGGVLLADSANNDVLRINQKREITTVARFLPEDVPWPDGLPFPGPPPGTPVPAESVPTAIAIGPDGAWYVSELKGFPFAKGRSRIWRIEPGAENATCDPANPNTGACTTYATGFTSGPSTAARRRSSQRAP
jgi:hypothetical protein